MMQWTLRTLAPTDVPVGPCAWRIALLPHHAAYLRGHPSLVVAGPDDDDDLLAAAAPHLRDLPVMLVVEEPPFARQFADRIAARMALLGRAAIDVLTLRVEDPAELKSGHLLQTLGAVRDAGRCRHLGLATDDVRSAEWLALNTTARVLVLPWSHHDQSARYRALSTAADYGMACVALSPDHHLPFALGVAHLVLPLLDRPLPPDAHPLPAADIDAAWQTYQSTHSAPAPLPRSRPPEDA